jgi:hypothetical protein
MEDPLLAEEEELNADEVPALRDNSSSSMTRTDSVAVGRHSRLLQAVFGLLGVGILIPWNGVYHSFVAGVCVCVRVFYILARATRARRMLARSCCTLILCHPYASLGEHRLLSHTPACLPLLLSKYTTNSLYQRQTLLCQSLL